MEFKVLLVLVCIAAVCSILISSWRFSVGDKVLGVAWVVLAVLNLYNLCGLVVREAVKGIK